MITKTTVTEDNEIRREYTTRDLTLQLNEVAFHDDTLILRVTDDDVKLVMPEIETIAPHSGGHKVTGERIIETVEKHELEVRKPDELDLTREDLFDDDSERPTRSRWKRKYLCRIDLRNRNKSCVINTEHVNRDEIDALTGPFHELIMIETLERMDDLPLVSFSIVE